jgi:hypothetical protein
MKHLILSAAISFLIVNNMYAQDECKVAMQSLQGKYEGGCKDGKANGEGKAEGVDTYKGSFKNGFPEGAGEYTWANKDKYNGNFRKGQLEGKGEMHYATKSGRDSVVTGFWKKNAYVGIYEKPWVVNDKTSKANKVDINIAKRGTSAGSITINSSQLSGGSGVVSTAPGANNSAMAGAVPIPVITEISVLAGQYNVKTSSNLTKTSVTRLQQMIFPFRARFTYSNGEFVDITFNEQADYAVDISFL